MRISDWSSDVCASDLLDRFRRIVDLHHIPADLSLAELAVLREIVVAEEELGLVAAVGAVVDAGDVELPGLARLRLRSEERRVGKECVSTCRSRRSRYP